MAADGVTLGVLGAIAAFAGYAIVQKGQKQPCPAQSCPAGELWDQGLCRCHAQQGSCPAGQVLDATGSACVSCVPRICDVGYQWDVLTCQCQPIPGVPAPQPAPPPPPAPAFCNPGWLVTDGPLFAAFGGRFLLAPTYWDGSPAPIYVLARPTAQSCVRHPISVDTMYRCGVDAGQVRGCGDIDCGQLRQIPAGSEITDCACVLGGCA